MSDTRATDSSTFAGEIPPRPDPLVGSAHEGETRWAGDGPARPEAGPFEPFSDPRAEPDARPDQEPAPADEPAPEPKRRRRWRRRGARQRSEAEVPLEEGHAEPVPGPRGMFGSDPAGSSAATGQVPPTPPMPGTSPALSTPGASPITPFEREARAPEPEPAPPPVAPTPGRYRLPDEFAFGPGAKPPKAKRKG
jgi:hypothetical protein